MELIFDTAATTLGIIMGMAAAFVVFVLLAVIAVTITDLVIILIYWISKQIKGGK